MAGAASLHRELARVLRRQPHHTMQARHKFRSVLFGLFSFCCFLSSVAAKPVKFDIPAQPAGEALIAFSKQSGLDVLYAYKDLQAVRSPAVVGEMEPDVALALLLKDTGFTATRDSGKFVVAKAKAASTGSVRGSLSLPGGAPAAGVLVVVRETSQSAETDQDGQFFFNAVAPGSHVLVVRAEGCQPLHITDVTVKAGNELLLSKETLHKLADGVTELQPFVVRGESVEQLDKYSVYGARQKPFESGNMDVPRTINDVQPYYIFDTKTIDRASALDLEDFLKQRLTMNTLAQGESDVVSTTLRARSSINLRGLGLDGTLVLVNGRRSAAVQLGTSTGQTDLNGIPLSAVERIEVLPSSASGIYGGSAIGGVVNVILKRHYSGGEIRASYDNTWDTDAPRRTLSATWGQTLEDGRTNVMLNASWSDAGALLKQDRIELWDRWTERVLRAQPSLVYTDTFAPLGATPNIYSYNGTPLTLKDGTALGSAITFLPAGISPQTSSAALAAALLANAGKYNLAGAPTAQWDGLLQPINAVPTNKAVMGSVRRSFLPKLEAFAEFAYNTTRTVSIYNPFSNRTIYVAATVPTTPFREAVRVRFPDSVAAEQATSSETRRATIGLLAKLPAGWLAETDYTWSENRYRYSSHTADAALLGADVNSGVLNPFVDTLRHPLDLTKYYVPQNFRSNSLLHDLSLRGSGPLWRLPWGEPSLTVGLQYRRAIAPERSLDTIYPLSPADTTLVTYFERQQTTESAYAEMLVPLAPRARWRGLHALEAQFAARAERYTVTTGTPSKTFSPAANTTSYAAPTLAGAPFSAEDNYQSNNLTAGFKYQPVDQVIVRASWATAFLPPTPAQLQKNPEPSASFTNVTDPVRGTRYGVRTVGGGNPALLPQNSESFNGGIIWQPVAGRFEGVRLGLEWYRVTQFDKIGALTAQQIVNAETAYPDRVTRDAAGLITVVDISMLNLFKYQTEGWDLSGDYRRRTSWGDFTLRFTGTLIRYEKRQLVKNGPLLDYAGHLADGGPLKRKATAELTWERNEWTLGWNARYIGSYMQVNAPGGPSEVQFGPYDYYLVAQGGNSIPAQTFHDVFAGYTFRERKSGTTGFAAVRAGLFADLVVQLGVKNVFDMLPAYDAYSKYSPYADTRLRSYWVSLRKSF